MRKIVLLCAQGMSTSLLVNKMRASAEDQGYECEINAYPVASIAEHQDADIILLGPQVRFQESNIKKQYPNLVVATIDMRMYGTMDGKGVIASVKKALGD